MRHVLLNTLPTMVGRAVGCLLGEAAFFVGLFFYYSLKKKEAPVKGEEPAATADEEQRANANDQYVAVEKSVDA